MSRSVHATRRHLELERRFGISHRDGSADRLWLIQNDLAQKRRIKAESIRTRERGSDVIPPVMPEIQADDLPTNMHFPASGDDVREVLARLPDAMWTGLTRIQLRSGFGEEREAADEVDPWHGVAEVQLFAGVWAQRVLGTYSRWSTSIDLYAFAFDDGALSPTAAARHLLRFQMLATLVHEVGHHYDFTARRARGRWRMHDTWRVERYADSREVELAETVVLPYLAERYPADSAALHEFVAEAGGVAVPLELAARSLDASIFAVHSAIYDLMDDHARGESVESQRLEFARQLHYADEFDLANAALRRLLSDHPGHPGATLLLADIAEHQGRLEDAEQLAAEAERLGAPRVEVVEVLLNTALARRDWRRVRGLAEEFEGSGVKALSWEMGATRLVQALAELGRFDEADAAMESLRPKATSVRAKGRLAGLAALLLVYRRQWQSALDFVTAQPVEYLRGRLIGGAELRAASWLAAKGLNLSPSSVPTVDDVNLLGWRAHDRCISELNERGFEAAPPKRQTRAAALATRRDLQRL